MTDQAAQARAAAGDLTGGVARDDGAMVQADQSAHVIGGATVNVRTGHTGPYFAVVLTDQAANGVHTAARGGVHDGICDAVSHSTFSLLNADQAAHVMPAGDASARATTQNDSAVLADEEASLTVSDDCPAGRAVLDPSAVSAGDHADVVAGVGPGPHFARHLNVPDQRTPMDRANQDADGVTAAEHARVFYPEV